jgi:transcription initiation factor IIF auxiliary subunit
MALQLKNSVIKDRAGRAKYKVFRDGGRRHFHVGVWLHADDPAEIKNVIEVTYTLHPTFNNSERQSRNRANDFSITFWTWGAFAVHAKAIFRDGTEVSIPSYVLQFPDEDLAELFDVTNR